jgi:hypothetical protein
VNSESSEGQEREQSLLLPSNKTTETQDVALALGVGGNESCPVRVAGFRV